MNMDKLNRWMTLGANIGVLAGILLLAFELNQNSELMRAQISNERSGQAIEMWQMVIESDDLSEILAEIGGPPYGSDLSSLSPAQVQKYKAFLRTQRFFHENLLQQQILGHFYDVGQLHAARDMLLPALQQLDIVGGPEFEELLRQVAEIHGE